MKKLYAFAAIALLTLILSTAVRAQEWTKEQTEVWKVVQDEWANWKAGNIDAMAAAIHEKYQGWSSDSPLPVGKTEMIAWYNSMKGQMKVNYLELQPARITVTKTSAVVDYYFSANATYTMGGNTETKDMQGKAVEFYVLESGKWLLLGDMTVFVPAGK
jgi:hypothetical protein